MNVVNLIGRIVAEPEIRYSQSNIAVCKFRLAVNRRTKDKQADFISCISFEKTAELLSKQSKGSLIGITGSIQTGSYDNKEGKKVYTTEVLVREITFCESKHDKGDSPSDGQQQDGFFPVTEDDELPFS